MSALDADIASDRAARKVSLDTLATAESDPAEKKKLEQEALRMARVVTPLTRKSHFFFAGFGTGSNHAGPVLFDWLKNIIAGKDLLSATVTSGLSAAMGAMSVRGTPGDKDYKLAKFEVRGSVSHGGNFQPAAMWVSYAKDVFDAAAKRGGDTPDDPTTQKVNEASKTGLKK